MNSTQVIHDHKKELLQKRMKLATGFIPALLLTILMIVSLCKVKFNLRGDSHADTLYLILMIVMLGISIILPILGRGKIASIWGAILFVGTPFVSFFLLEFYTHNPFKDSPIMDQNIMYLNTMFFYLLLFLVTVLATRSDVGIAVTAGIPMIFGLANFMAMQFRNAPIFPWDVLSFGTAMSVLDNYSLTLSTKFFFILYVFTFIIGTAFLSGFRFRLKKVWIHAVIAIIMFGLFSGYCAYCTTDDAEDRFDLYPYLFSANYLYKHNGCVVSFISTTKFLKLDAPKGYDTSSLHDLYDAYYEKANQTVKEDGKLPNLIVIMNEGFFDPATLWDFETNIDYMPFIHSLTDRFENAAVGNVYVSVKGGNTPNSEFEFLTGTSMAFLPTGSIPYQQHIKGNTLSLVSQLNDLGYLTIAMHPYGASGWDRDEVYPYLGFDDSYFSGDFKNRKYVRSYISDETMFKQIMSLQESKKEGEPLFVFGVTMQNHGDYPNKNNGTFVPEVKVLNNNNSYISYFNNYLSLLKVTDHAFQKLVEYYDNINEPTIILMFGDHQSNDHVVSPILKANDIDMSDPTLELLQTRYITPYILWANYDIEEQFDLPETTSANYLAALLLSQTDIPLTPFQTWQLELMETYPAMNANGFFDSDWQVHSVKDIYEEPLLNLYAQIQYNLVFDKKHTVSTFFSTTVN